MRKVLTVAILILFTLSMYAMEITELKEKMHKKNMELVNSIKNIYIKQKSTSSAMNVEAYQTIIATKDKAKIENTINYTSQMTGNPVTASAYIIANGKGTYMYVPTRKNATDEELQADLFAYKLSTDMMGKLVTDADKGNMISLIFSDYSEMIPDNATIEKTEKVEGIKCYKVVINDGMGNTMSLWISKKNYLPVKIELSGTLNGTTQTQTTYFKKYKKIAGKMGVPYLMETYMNGNLMDKNEVVEIKVNKGVKESEFVVP